MRLSIKIKEVYKNSALKEKKLELKEKHHGEALSLVKRRRSFQKDCDELVTSLFNPPLDVNFSFFYFFFNYYELLNVYYYFANRIPFFLINLFLKIS